MADDFDRALTSPLERYSFYTAFDFLLTGAKSPAEAMKACLFETAGTA